MGYIMTFVQIYEYRASDLSVQPAVAVLQRSQQFCTVAFLPTQRPARLHFVVLELEQLVPRVDVWPVGTCVAVYSLDYFGLVCPLLLEHSSR